MARGLANLDLGLSDDEDITPAPRRAAGKKGLKQKEESIEDLLGGKDSAMMFGASPGGRQRRATLDFGLGGSGSGDPLDMLRDNMQRRSSAPLPPQEPEFDEEELRFQLELQKELGMAGLGDAAALGGPDMSALTAGSFAQDQMPSRRSPSPALKASSGGGDSDESLGDIVGDILDETPAPRKSPPRRSTTPGRDREDVASLIDQLDDGNERRPSQRSAPGSRAGSNPPRQGGYRDESLGRADSQDGDESPALSRRGSSSRPPRAERSLADGRSARDESPFTRDDSSLAREDMDYEAGFRQRTQEPPGRGRRAPSTAPSYTSDREGSIASEHSGGPGDPAHLPLGRRGGRASEVSGDASFQAASFSATETDPMGGTQSTGLGGRAGRRKLAPRPSSVAADDDPLADILGTDNSTPGGASRGQPGRSVSPGMASGAESRGSATPPGYGRPVGSSVADTEGNEDAPLYAPKAEVPQAGPSFDVELNVGPKPKRRLGGAKAKASPAPSASRTPPLEDELPSGRGTPQGGRSATPPHFEEPLSPGPLPMDDQASAAAFSASASGVTGAPPERLQSPAHSMPQDDNDNDDDFDDLLPDNTAPPPPVMAAAAPEPEMPAAAQTQPKEGSDDDLPDFLKAGRERRARRGDQPRAQLSTGLDLGFSAEDLDPSDQSASQLDKMPVPGVEDSSASGSLLDVQLSTKPKGGRRLAKAKPKAKSAVPAAAPIEEEGPLSQAGSVAGSALSQAASGSRASPAGAASQAPAGSPTQSAAPSLGSRASPHGAASQAPAGSPAPSLGQSAPQSAPQSVHSAAHSSAHMSAPQPLLSPQAASVASMGLPPASVGLTASPHGSVGITGSIGAPGSVAASGGLALGAQSQAASSVPQTPAGAGFTGAGFVQASAMDAVQLAQAQALSAAASVRSAAQSLQGQQAVIASPRLAQAQQAAIVSPRLMQLGGQAPLQPPGMDSQPPSVHGDAFAAFSALPLAGLPRASQDAAGLPPGSPLTQTVQSESGSLHARFRIDDPIAAPQSLAGVRASAAAKAAALDAAVAAGSPLPGESKKSTVAGAGGTPTSEPVLSLFGSDAAHMDLGGRAHGGFSAFPPLSAAPSADLLSKLAYSEAKVKQLELQLEDAEGRRIQQLGDAKQQADAEHERMELQCRRLEAELDRTKEIHKADMNHLNDKKQLLLQNFEMEKDSVRREEKSKASLQEKKLKQDHEMEKEEMRRKHERALSIAQQQSDTAAENFLKNNAGEHQLAKLVEQVQGSVLEVERMSKRVETDKSLEWTVRERQLEAREKNVREMEARLTSQSKLVEDQRLRVSELVRHMEDSQVDERASLALEKERLKAEHDRLKSLQQTIRDTDRNNTEQLKRAWAQLQDEKHSFQQEQLRLEGETGARREELELQERQLRQETERLKALHTQVEAARQNASRRIRETEALVANERRCLMNDLEIFEEKRRIFAGEVQKLDCEKQSLVEDRSGFDQEVRSVGQMAVEVSKKSEELKTLQDEAIEARGEIQRLRGQLQEERTAQGSELERLKTMQTLVEQQRLQLLQTENQIHVRSFEDVDLLVTRQTTFPASDPAAGTLVSGALGMGFGGTTSPGVGTGVSGPMEAMASQLGPMQAFLTGTAAGQGPPQTTPGQTLSPHNLAVGGLQPQPQELVTTAAPSKIAQRAAAPGLGSRMPATPGIASSRSAARSATSSRMELQTLLRRTREESGEMQIFIQEQFRFLQQQQQAEIGQAGARDAGSFAQVPVALPRGAGSFAAPGGGGASASRFTPPEALPAGIWPSSGTLSRTPGFGHHSGSGFGALAGHANYMSADSLGLAPLTSTSEEGDGVDYVSPTFEPFRPLSSDVELTSGGSAN